MTNSCNRPVGGPAIVGQGSDDLDYAWSDTFWDDLERDLLDPVFRENFLAALEAINRP